MPGALVQTRETTRQFRVLRIFTKSYYRSDAKYFASAFNSDVNRLAGLRPSTYDFFSGPVGSSDGLAAGFSSRRDSAQPEVLQVGTPILGSSHWVRTSQPTTTAINQTHCGMFRPSPGCSSHFIQSLTIY